MNLLEKLPPTAASLVALLDEAYPHRCPKPREDAEEVQRYAGKRELIDLLLSRLEDPYQEKENEPMTWMQGAG